MNRLFRLAPVLRARKAQEDAARGAVIQSRTEIREAEALLKRRKLDLVGADAPSEGSARAMVAALVARQSLAAGLFDAQRMVTSAEPNPVSPNTSDPAKAIGMSASSCHCPPRSSLRPSPPD